MHQLYKLVLLTVLGITMAQPLFAQDTCTYTLSGRVVDEHDGQPLLFADVQLLGTEIGAVTDTAGYYQIKGLCKGTYTVRCMYVGCEPVAATLVVKGDTQLNLYPELHADLLAGVTIVGKKQQVTVTQSTQTLTKKELNQSKGESLGNSLSKVTGVTTLATGNNIAKPVIHGLHSNRILILNNGVRQEGQQWGNEHAPEIDPFIADELTVIKGANSVRFGPDAIAGVILVNPKPLPKKPGIGGELNLVGFSNGRQYVASSMIEGNSAKLPPLSWRLQGTYKQGGNVHAPNYFLKNTGVQEYNFSWAAAYTKAKFGVETFYSQFNTDIGVFSAAHIGNLTDLQRAFEADEPLESADFTYAINRPWQQIQHELFKATAYWYIGEAGKLNFSYARQYNKRLEYDKDEALNDSIAALNLPALQFEITTHTSDLYWEHKRVLNLKGSVGVSGIHQGNTFAGRMFIPNFRKYGSGAYWIEHWKPTGNKLELETGIRFDYIFQEIFLWQNNVIYSPEYSYTNVSGSVGGLYTFNDKFLLRANAGTAWRPPNVNELYSDGVHHGAAAVEIGDTSLVTEQAYNLTASAEYKGKKLKVNADVYYNYINNFIYLKPTLPPTLTIRGAFPTFNYSQVNATLQGFDFTVNYALPFNFNVTSKASILRAYNTSTNEYLVQMPADRFTHTLEYKLPKRKKISDAYIAISVLQVMKQWRVESNSDFVAPPNGYVTVGLQAGLTVPLGQQKMNIGMGVNNLFNAVYRDYLNRFRYYADEMGTNVSLKINVPFDILQAKNN